MQTTVELFSDLRLTILKAVQAGNIDEVTTLLTNNPELIRAKTTSTQASLLHIAAQYNHLTLCERLLAFGHNSNPVNKEGKTPYQLTRSIEIQQLLCSTYIASSSILRGTIYDGTGPQQVYYDEGCIFKDICFLSDSDLLAHPLNYCDESHYFAMTALSPLRDSVRYLITLFREKVIMTPYYGELLLKWELEQAIQFMEYATQHKMHLYQQAVFETRAAATAIHFLLTTYPELQGYPLSTDRPEVSHAKKLIIGFALHIFQTFYAKLKPDQINELSQLEAFRYTTELAALIQTGKNKQKNARIRAEMSVIYEFSDEDRVKATLSRPIAP